MKRLISLVVLICCSLIASNNSYAETQTWRLTNDVASDSTPKITRDNEGSVWTIWLSDKPGNFDIYCRKFTGTVWGDTFRVYKDALSQKYLAIANDNYNGRVWLAWDSVVCNDSTQIKIGYCQNDSLKNVQSVIDSIQLTLNVSGLFLQCRDTSEIFIAWSSGNGIISGYLRQSKNNIWDTIQTVLPGYMDMLSYRNEFVKGIILGNDGKAYIQSETEHYSMGSCWWYEVSFATWVEDSGWVKKRVSSTPLIYPSTNYLFSIAGLACDDNSFLSIYSDSLPSGQKALVCKKYEPVIGLYDSVFNIYYPTTIQSGAADINTLAWSDSHSIFLNTYYDSIWSQPPVQISDTSLHNCINPDIVAENDSTVWVCYQNDGDIYVTKTTVPLGVSGRPEEINKPRVFSVKTWPNPARNKVNILCNGLNNKYTKANIYNITGQLVKSIDIKENQTVWNCTDQDGKKISSGIYILNVLSGEENRIQKISILK